VPPFLTGANNENEFSTVRYDHIYAAREHHAEQIEGIFRRAGYRVQFYSSIPANCTLRAYQCSACGCNCDLDAANAAVAVIGARAAIVHFICEDCADGTNFPRAIINMLAEAD
jgi:hypothetical protein